MRSLREQLNLLFDWQALLKVELAALAETTP
jgi:hypothetical protein